MIRIVKGSLLRANEDILGHQVNTLGAMGAGLAKQIKEKYPYVYEDYKNLCNSNNGEDLLGRA